jgi:hypothetical protein
MRFFKAHPANNIHPHQRLPDPRLAPCLVAAGVRRWKSTQVLPVRLVTLAATNGEIVWPESDCEGALIGEPFNRRAVKLTDH